MCGNKKTLSIVMATYNGERFLREQLDSLYRQTLQPDEVLVVDDCSTDGTVGILEEYRRTRGLKYVVNEHNLRVNKNFEKGILMASGDYISLCDQDDVWFKEKNECLYNRLVDIESKYPNRPCLVSSRNTFVNENMQFHYSTELKNDTNDYRETIMRHLSQGSSMMFNRKCIDLIMPLPEFDTGICYDTHIGYIIAMVGHKYDLKQSLMYYRVHGNNVTAQLEKKERERGKVRRFRNPSVVPSHMIRAFMFAQSYIAGKIEKDKQDYVNRIIELSYSINIIKRIWYLLSTAKIPLYSRIYSLKAVLANMIFAPKSEIKKH